MNTDLLNIIKQIVAERGESILSEPKIVSAFLSDLARDVPKPQKNALIKCLEHNFAQTLKNVGKAERANCKQKLAEKLHNEEGLDIALCGNTIELLATVLFGEENPPAMVATPAKIVPPVNVVLPIKVASSSNTFTDPRDGKVYRTVKIGNQVWMAENLAFNASGSQCYSNDESNEKKYGRFYDWNTAMKACPPGWHLPSNDEWQTLVDFAGGEKIAGKKLKAKSGWSDFKGDLSNSTDEFNFTALPGGLGYSSGDFGDFGYGSYWWSSSKSDNANTYGWWNSPSESDSVNAYIWYMLYNYEYVNSRKVDKDALFSVRCLQDCNKKIEEK